jgi:hypothetical protein
LWSSTNAAPAGSNVAGFTVNMIRGLDLFADGVFGVAALIRDFRIGPIAALTLSLSNHS